MTNTGKYLPSTQPHSMEITTQHEHNGPQQFATPRTMSWADTSSGTTIDTNPWRWHSNRPWLMSFTSTCTQRHLYYWSTSVISTIINRQIETNVNYMHVVHAGIFVTIKISHSEIGQFMQLETLLLSLLMPHWPSRAQLGRRYCQKICESHKTYLIVVHEDTYISEHLFNGLLLEVHAEELSCALDHFSHLLQSHFDHRQATLRMFHKLSHNGMELVVALRFLSLGYRSLQFGFDLPDILLKRGQRLGNTVFWHCDHTKTQTHNKVANLLDRDQGIVPVSYYKLAQPEKKWWLKMKNVSQTKACFQVFSWD